jgi:phosphate starvation-inducible PhoH-like protein
LQEVSIQFESANPVEIFGVNNAHINIIKNYFPKLKIVARGTTIKAQGPAKELSVFNEKMGLLQSVHAQKNFLSEGVVEQILMDNGAAEQATGKEVLLHGAGGMIIKAKTVNQQKIVESSFKNDLVFAIGPAGTGKTYTAVALAVRALKNKEVRRIILTRPAVEAGEHLGFLPGDLKEKLDPYLQPLYDALRDMIPSDRLDDFIEKGVIQIAPLAFMRGRTLDQAFVILDEAQNATKSQMKMFLTRMGSSAKFVITGDRSQIDLPKSHMSGLVQAVRILSDVKGVGVVKLDERDVIRHPLVKRIIDAYDVDSDE